MRYYKFIGVTYEMLRVVLKEKYNVCVHVENVPAGSLVK